MSTTDDVDEKLVRKSLTNLVARLLSGGSGQYEAGHADVVFHQLSVEGAGQGVQEAPTVPTAALQLLNSFNPLTYLSQKAGSSRTLVHSFSGVIKGGEMLMVIGKPGSGCSTFLKVLANMRAQYKNTSGHTFYGGQSPGFMARQSPGELAFCGEDDVHFPSLSVETTLRFAVNSRTPSDTPNRRAQIEDQLAALAELFGLEKVLSTNVGDDIVRGVSGGQRHRVSLAETMATRAGLLCFDNPTRGLDSSTALRFVQVMREYLNQSRCASVMSLYQASDALAHLFDKVLVINSGHQVYYGPLLEAKAYFEGLGFYCPPNATLTDFLTSMTGDGKTRVVSDGMDDKIPRRPEEFEAAFRQSAHYQRAHHESDVSQLSGIVSSHQKTDYALSLYQQTLACCKRQFQIHFTDRGAWMTEGIGTLIQSIVLGTLFFNLQPDTHGLYTRGSALFFCVLIVALRASAELRSTFVQRPILLKHKSLRFYRPGAYAFGQTLADMPWKIVSIVYNIPLYFMVHLRWTASNFFIWFVSLYIAFLAISMMFRAIAVFTISPDRAALPVGIWLNVLIIYAGFYIAIPTMKVWLGWLRFLDPMYYAYESIMLNEFTSLSFGCTQANTVPHGTGYDNSQYQTCAISGSAPGQLSVAGEAYVASEYGFVPDHLWRNVGINAGFFLFFASCVAIGMERFKPAAGRLATVFYKKGLNLSRLLHKTEDIESQPVKQDHQSILDGNSHDSAVREKSTLPAGEVFSWKSLSLDIKQDGVEKRLLGDVTGWVKPGEMTALMGLSGAGKTTLMNTLSQRSSLGIAGGNMYLNGSPVPKSIRRRTGYVQQQDVHLRTSTVREALQVAAKLRQPAGICWKDKNTYVDEVIAMLEMEEIADALIGVPGAGLSLEKRKRVTIGVELAAKPDVITFFDEPTSGLDGDSAASIVQLMRKIANSGQSILCTIHQPTAQIIEQFDNLLLLAPGGKTVYFGPLGPHCGTVLGYFSRHSREPRSEENPAEYMLEVVSDNDGKPEFWAETWKESEEYRQQQKGIEQLLSNPGKSGDHSEDQSVYAAPYLDQLKTVLIRSFTNYWREPNYAVSKVLMNLFNALLNSLTFLQLDDSVAGARGRLFSLFVGFITAPPQMIQLEPRFAALRQIFLAREKENRTYHWTVFVISAILVEIPYALFSALVYWILWYYTVGFFYQSNRAAYGWGMYELYAIFYTTLGQMIAAATPNLPTALLATPFVYLVVNTFAGPLSPPPTTPSGWRWFFNVSPMFYETEGMATNFYHGLKIACKSGETSTFFAPGNQTCGDYAASFLGEAGGYITNPATIGRCDYCPYSTGDQYGNQYAFTYSHRGRNVGVFVAFIAFNYAVVFAGTYLMNIRQWKKRTA